MRSGLSESNAFILDAMLSCSPREPISFLETPQDSPTCFLSLPLPPAIIFTQSLSPPLDILQDKDLFSKHTADLSVFKICSSSKKRKTVMKEKNNKIMALLKLPGECELLLALHSCGLSTSLRAPNFSDFLPPYYVYSNDSILGHLPSCLFAHVSTRNDHIRSDSDPGLGRLNSEFQEVTHLFPVEDI